MNTQIFIAILLIVLPQAVGQLLTWTFWWQRKEYRVDRFKTVFGSHSRRKELGVVGITVKFTLLVTSFFFWPFIIIYLLLAIILDAKVIVRLLRRSTKRPVLTQRASRMFLITLLLLVASFFLNPLVLTLLVFEIFLLMGPLIGILLTKPAVDRARKAETNKASEKLTKIMPKVIGITGSYGKSSTKEFLEQILSEKYETLATYKNHNTDFGIARRIASDLKPNTQMFIAEMGAYKKGEIADISKFVQPSIGIITGIEAQHLDLFGSIENIMDAKFELIEALPDKGVAIFNASNSRTEKLAKRAEKLGSNLKILRYGAGFKNLDMEAKLIKVTTRGINFRVRERGKKWIELFAPIYGGHFVENLAGTILVARELGVSWEMIKKTVADIKLPDGTMNVEKKGGVVIVDDSQNATPNGFMAALDYLALYKDKKKIVVTPGIIELGNKSNEEHAKIARKMKEVGIDILFLTICDFEKLFRSELGTKVRVEILKSNKQLKSVLTDRSVVLVEEKVPKKLIPT